MRLERTQSRIQTECILEESGNRLCRLTNLANGREMLVPVESFNPKTIQAVVARNTGALWRMDP